MVKLCRKLYNIILSRKRLSYCLAVTEIKKLCACEHNYKLSDDYKLLVKFEMQFGGSKI